MGGIVTGRQRSTFQSVLRLVALTLIVYLSSGSSAGTPAPSLFAGFEHRLLCDMRWWLQLALVDEFDYDADDVSHGRQSSACAQ